MREDRKDTLMSLNNLGTAYMSLENYEKALECYERALEGDKRTKGKNHQSTLDTVMNIANVYNVGMKDYGKAEEICQRTLESFEAQLGKEDPRTKRCARDITVCLCLTTGENRETSFSLPKFKRLKLRKILDDYPHLIIEKPAFKNYL